MYILDSSALIEIFYETTKGEKIIKEIGQELATTTVFSIHELLKGATSKNYQY